MHLLYSKLHLVANYNILTKNIYRINLQAAVATNNPQKPKG